MATLDSLARSYAATYPRPGSGESSWDQMCGSLMFRMLDKYGKPPTGDIRSAYIVYERTAIHGRRSSDAPVGAFHFWAIGGRYNGHVALDLMGGGTRIFMATTHLHTSLGRAIGMSDVAQYSAATGARYLGWSRNYANGGSLRFDAQPPAKHVAISTASSGSVWGFNPPSASVQKSIQQSLKRRKRYYGPADGKFGVESIKGVQRTVANVGYSGLIDGKPGPMTCYYVQVYARKFGKYSGPLDKVLGRYSWAGFAAGLK